MLFIVVIANINLQMERNTAIGQQKDGEKRCKETDDINVNIMLYIQIK